MKRYGFIPFSLSYFLTQINNYIKSTRYAISKFTLKKERCPNHNIN